MNEISAVSYTHLDVYKRQVDTLEERVQAKKAGDKVTANALKLVLNTTYGTMLNGKDGVAFNDLYDPLMGLSLIHI